MRKTHGLDGAAIKWIALGSMLLDHIGLALVYLGYLFSHRLDRSAAALPLYYALRAVGRLAFPLYCFLLAEGVRHTRDRSRYLLRLLCFCLVSEIPFDLALRRTILEWGHQNVFFTLSIGMLAILGWEEATRGRGWDAEPGQKVLGLLVLAAAAALAYFLKTDYGAPGVLLILVLYLLRDMPWERDVFVVLVLALMVAMGSHRSEMLGCLALLPMHCYNGERGRQSKALFYVFYPAHLLLLAGLRALIWGI